MPASGENAQSIRQNNTEQNGEAAEHTKARDLASPGHSCVDETVETQKTEASRSCGWKNCY